MNTNRQLIEQFLQFINTGDATIGKPIISDDVIFYAPTSPEPMKGFEGYMGVLAMMRGAMPDIQWKIEETISEGDKILVRYTMTGTQTQPLMGMPATGKNSANVNFSTECSMIRINSSRLKSSDCPKCAIDIFPKLF